MGTDCSPRLVRQNSQYVMESEDDTLSDSASLLNHQPAHQSLIPSYKQKGIGILLMGLTGAGKSTFISGLTRGVRIGHSLESCTTTVDPYLRSSTTGQNIWLIDTPGFDDTNKPNAVVLRNIASFLCTFCDSHGLSIGGLIYFHRITDPRMSNSSLESIRIFEKLCGHDNFRAVYVVTTMWDMLQTEAARNIAIEREEVLRGRPDFFGRLVEGGARFPPHTNTVVSSSTIVDRLIDLDLEVRLAVCGEMRAKKGSTLAETSVGRYLQGELEEKRKTYEAKIRELEVYKRKGMSRGRANCAPQTAYDNDNETVNSNDDNEDEIGDRVKDGDEDDDDDEDYDDDADSNSFDEDIATEFQEQILLTKENINYLDITYEEMVEESNFQRSQYESSEIAAKLNSQRLEPLQRDTVIRERLNQAEKLKDQTEPSNQLLKDRNEAVKEPQERFLRAKALALNRIRFFKLFSPLLQSPKKQLRTASAPPDSRRPKQRDARNTLTKKRRQRVSVRPDNKTSSSGGSPSKIVDESYLLAGTTDHIQHVSSPADQAACSDLTQNQSSEGPSPHYADSYPWKGFVNSSSSDGTEKWEYDPKAVAWSGPPRNYNEEPTFKYKY